MEVSAMQVLWYLLIAGSGILSVLAQQEIAIPENLFPPPDSIVRYAPDSSRLLFHPVDSFTVYTRHLGNSFWGFSLLFSPYGIGLGAHYQHAFSSHLRAFLNLDISGIRKTDEFEYYYPKENQFLVPGKINRLYTLPLTAGVQYRIFSETFADTFQPLLIAGIGVGMIAATPYRKNRRPDGEFVDFWSSLKEINFYLRPAMVFGTGLQFSTSSDSRAQFSVRYYYIPFGGQGLESVAGIPITNFGGLFFSLTFLLNF